MTLQYHEGLLKEQKQKRTIITVNNEQELSGKNSVPDYELKRILKELGETISETLADSPKINNQLQEIRDAGYELLLVIEAKVGFSRKWDKETESRSTLSDKPVQLNITSEDSKFLKSLKISSE